MQMLLMQPARAWHRDRSFSPWAGREENGHWPSLAFDGLLSPMTVFQIPWASSEEARLQLRPKASLGLSPTPDATSELRTPSLNVTATLRAQVLP